MEELFGHIRMILYVALPLGAIIAGYVRLGGKVDNNKKDVATLEKEFIKELDDVDDKLERVFAVLKESDGVRERLKELYLLKTEHEKDCRIKTMEINETIHKSEEAIKEQFKKDVTEVRGDLQRIYELLSQGGMPTKPKDVAT